MALRIHLHITVIPANMSAVCDVQNSSVHYWYSLGCPLDKLVLGLATYARTFLMSSAAQYQPGDPYLGTAGPPGPFSALSLIHI